LAGREFRSLRGSTGEFRPVVFETAPFNHSGTSPLACLHEFAGLPQARRGGAAHGIVYRMNHERGQLAIVSGLTASLEDRHHTSAH
jgi:hypothetical protein